MDRDDIYYEALRTRDPRFDGKFFVGVRTTGIYCRPICPAKPKRENVEFFPTAPLAERAGYRPCLRCRPECAPASPSWIGTSALVRRALRALNRQDALALDENEFAARFGVTARHLRRLFVDEIGKTPKQLSFENRLNLARKLVTETRLPLAEVAYAAGFRSIRRFNDSFAKRFRKNPNRIRRGGARPEGEYGMRVTLAYRPPFHYDALLEAYSSHRVGNLEWHAPGEMTRVVAYGDRVGVVKVSNDPERSQLVVEIDFPDTSMTHAILARVRAMFDLDSDPLEIANSLDTDPKTRAILRKHPGIRLASGWDPYEIAIGTILGQLVTVEWARTLVVDLVTLLGKETDLRVPPGFPGAGETVRLFPTPEAVVNADLSSIRSTNARKQTLVEFSRALVEKRVSLEPTQSVEHFLKTILAIRGIGPWTANYLALRVLRHTDAFPGTDLILARALEIHLPEVVERMSPWRGYAAVLYWREYAGTLKKKPAKKVAKKASRKK